MKSLSITSIIVAVVGFLATLFTLTACTVKVERTNKHSQHVNITEKQELKSFSKLNVCHHIKVIYHVDSTECSIRLKGEKDKINRIGHWIYDDELRIFVGDFDSKSIDLHLGSPVYLGDVTVHVTGPALRAITVTGHAQFECADEMHVEKCEYFTTNHGELELRSVVADESCILHASGNSDIEIKKLQSPQTLLQQSNTGDIDVHFDSPNGTAECNAGGAGEIELSGRLGTLKSSPHTSAKIKTEHLHLTH